MSDSSLSINLSNFNLVKAKIGVGASGTVDLMKKNNDETIFAVKTFHTKLNSDEEKHFFGEIETMASLKNRYILRIEGYQIANQANEWKAAIVMEYASNGSLRNLMNSGEQFDKVKVLWEITRGMKYLHKRGKIHCDLKPENILFDDEMTVKIGDFGLSRDEDNTMTMGNGTPSYMAPELVETSHYNRKVDVFAFGQMMIELLSGEPIYPKGMLPVSIIAQIQQKKLPPIPLSVEEPFRSLAERCRAIDPENRPEFSKIENELYDLMDPADIEADSISEYMEYSANELVQKIKRAYEKIDALEEDIQMILRPGLQLIRAIKDKNLDKILQLINEGVDVNDKDRVFVNLLSDIMFNFNDIDKMFNCLIIYCTPLHHSIKMNNEVMSQILLKNGADIESKDHVRTYSVFEAYDVQYIMTGRLN